ncbi:MAG: sulfotransferase domain-containing protein [Alphaproteobacteria bacterium]|nr:sulfotransferase domain-containing protein [Alphaproteobacteria bacterium]MBU0796802.1 sulfotransferase domain-containing protein [Alphaproteobacteria bacterium]MBU0885840.1 sulfotransferase domain-containing protein [Alphaproteobacteria bacterium]MBU1812083.1 sulfotransferase domain-containing protein [Alphaproteobacteria bacterium]MBU2091513.1 sulfotransferase domain-containing protein [Alphaproteobacteria bacterium]
MAFAPPGLVWLASYPKSGNTWMRVLLSNLMTGRDEPADINRLSEEESLIGRWRFADDMLVDADQLSWQEVEMLRPLHYDYVADRLDKPVFCKTHDRFESQSGGPILGNQARAALYLLRDPRDVAVSLIHHLGRPTDQVVALMIDTAHLSGGGIYPPYLLGDWGGHVSGWTGQGVIPTKVVRYEDIRRDTVEVLRGIVCFLGITATAEEIRRAVAHSDLDELKQQEAAKGFRERQQGQTQFFRSGRVGEWRDVLNDAQIRTIEAEFAPVMTRWGYSQAG